jgi:hypothetical protein
MLNKKIIIYNTICYRRLQSDSIQIFRNIYHLVLRFLFGGKIIQSETIRVLLMLALLASIGPCISDDHVYISLGSGSFPFPSVQLPPPSTISNPPKPYRFENFKDISSSIGNRSGPLSKFTNLSNKSAPKNITVKVKWLNLSTNEIILTNTNKTSPLNVSGWEVVSTSLNGDKKRLNPLNETFILPASSLRINVSSVEGPGLIILKDEVGSIVWMGCG